MSKLQLCDVRWSTIPFEINDSQVFLKDYLSWYLLSAKDAVSILAWGQRPQEWKSNHDKRWCFGEPRIPGRCPRFATANGAAGNASDMDGLSREAEGSGSE